MLLSSLILGWIFWIVEANHAGVGKASRTPLAYTRWKMTRGPSWDAFYGYPLSLELWLQNFCPSSFYHGTVDF